MDDADAPVRRMLDQWHTERPDLDVQPMALFGRLGRADALAQTAINANLAGFGLVRGEYDVLATLRRAGAPHRLTPTQLATAMLLSPAATTHRLTKLAAAGLIDRDADPDDGRGSLVTLTAAGLELVDRATDQHVEGLAGLLSGLGVAERAELSRLLGVLLIGLGGAAGAG